MRIKAANMNDLPSVVKLALKLWPENDYEELLKEMTELLADHKALLLFASDQDNAVAFAHCQLRHDYVEGTDSSPVGYLEGIYVEESYRMKGIARSLLTQCEKWAKDNGCHEFASDCELDNTDSFKFHLNAGFTEANRIICFTKKI